MKNDTNIENLNINLSQLKWLLKYEKQDKWLRVHKTHYCYQDQNDAQFKKPAKYNKGHRGRFIDINKKVIYAN